MGRNGKKYTSDISANLRVALVYDRVNKWGGAERVVIALRKMFPNAHLFTSVYEKNGGSWAKKIEVFPSFLQKIPFASKHHEALGALMPLAFESFNFEKYDLVISVTSEAAKGILTTPKTRHICICLTPTRYLWSGYSQYFSNQLFKLISWPIVYHLREWDRIAAMRPDSLIAISKTVSERIKKYYGLTSEIIYPPLMIRNNLLKTSTHFAENPYFLVVSRLVPYKKVDLAIKAANKLKLPLKIVGTGNEYGKLKKLAGPTVELLGYVSDKDLKSYYLGCKALIFPGIEDFGLTMVEAQSFGKPVIAFRAGGAEEIIIEGKTGVFFDKQNVASLSQVLKSFRSSRYNTKDCVKNAKRFSFEQFERKLKNIISKQEFINT